MGSCASYPAGQNPNPSQTAVDKANLNRTSSSTPCLRASPFTKLSSPLQNTHQIDVNNDKKRQHVSETAKDFRPKFLDKNTATRIRSARTDAKNVKMHPFFEDIDWVDVSEMQFTPPLEPGLSLDNRKHTPEDVKITQLKLAYKVRHTYKPSRATMSRLKRVIGVGEYKMVITNSSRIQGSVSIAF